MSQNKLSNAGSTPEGRAYFESQRAALMGEIGVSLEHTLSAINKLNRSLEGVIAVGNEFGSVEALWSTFEAVMGQDPNANATAAASADDEGDTTLGERREEGRRQQRSQEGQGWKSENEGRGR